MAFSQNLKFVKMTWFGVWQGSDFDLWMLVKFEKKIAFGLKLLCVACYFLRFKGCFGDFIGRKAPNFPQNSLN